MSHTRIADAPDTLGPARPLPVSDPIATESTDSALQQRLVSRAKRDPGA